MGVAIMVHKEANGVDGGRLDPAGSNGITNTFYPRKLNTLLVNQNTTLLAFDGTNFTFTVGPGTYRIEARMVINGANPTAPPQAQGYCAGLFNLTTGLFEVYSNTIEAILATAGNIQQSASGPTAKMDSNMIVNLFGQFIVTSSNKTYQLQHKTNNANPASTLWASSTTFCGAADQCSTNNNVNGSKSSNFYAVVKIGRES